jgi:hypothetical protein
VFILKTGKVVCFATLLQVLILSDLSCTKMVQMANVAKSKNASKDAGAMGLTDNITLYLQYNNYNILARSFWIYPGVRTPL